MTSPDRNDPWVLGGLEMGMMHIDNSSEHNTQLRKWICMNWALQLSSSLGLQNMHGKIDFSRLNGWGDWGIV